jgi:hypothetical protein
MMRTSSSAISTRCANARADGLADSRQAGDALLRHGVVLVHHAGFDRVKETAERLVGFGDRL